MPIKLIPTDISWEKLFNYNSASNIQEKDVENQLLSLLLTCGYDANKTYDKAQQEVAKANHYTIHQNYIKARQSLIGIDPNLSWKGLFKYNSLSSNAIKEIDDAYQLLQARLDYPVANESQYEPYVTITKVVALENKSLVAKRYFEANHALFNIHPDISWQKLFNYDKDSNDPRRDIEDKRKELLSKLSINANNGSCDSALNMQNAALNGSIINNCHIQALQFLNIQQSNIVIKEGKAFFEKNNEKNKELPTKNKHEGQTVVFNYSSS